ncbi:hypothetical protein [Comamonas jiangduensis]|uniref:hypothetical protein n=1 Tax=Comamonas jiangduensis TaxID=1194168 RepID=UPI0024E0E223|nr:hypothetical protein [Comamonas jiangduensis]
MAATPLVFKQQHQGAGNPVQLVLGADEGAPQPKYMLAAVGRLSLGMRGAVRVAAVQRVTAVGRITAGLRGPVAVGWHVNVSRPSVAMVTDAAQPAQSLRAAVQGVWQQSMRTQTAITQIWQDARHVSEQVRALWQQAKPLRGAGVDVMQDAASVRHGMRSGFEQSLRRYSAALDVVQDAQALRVATLVAFEQAVRLRNALQGSMQQALPASGRWFTSFAHGLPVRLGVGGRYQEAAKPGPGQWVWPLPPNPQPKPCYVPGLPAALVFDQASASGLPAALVFRCKRKAPEPQPTPHYVIPLLPAYMQVHHLTAHLLPGMEPVPLSDLTLSADDDGYGWSLTANGPEHLMEQLAPMAGLPARVRVEINGIAFVFAITSTARSRSFERKRVAVLISTQN